MKLSPSQKVGGCAYNGLYVKRGKKEKENKALGYIQRQPTER